jgi:hypothetical protein
MTNDLATGQNPYCYKGLAKVTVLCSADSLVVAESSVLRIKFCGKKPAQQKSAIRCGKPGQK